MESPTTKKIHLTDTISGAQQDRNQLVCASCYGELEIKILQQDGRRTQGVTCATEGCSCPGLVTRKWVEQAKEANALDSMVAQATVRQAVPWLPKKTQAQLMKELGF